MCNGRFPVITWRRALRIKIGDCEVMTGMPDAHFYTPKKRLANRGPQSFGDSTALTSVRASRAARPIYREFPLRIQLQRQ
jgi:hypothetical protein